ncbi:MAG: VOC family protein [Planctomycetes bacterium]|nr:VOC family protein [Planctomycetota bacterium]
MHIQTIVPIVTTDRLAETRAFYVEKLGFQVAFDHDHYLGLRAGAAGSPELGFMRPDHDAPKKFEGGVTFGLRVDDADREHARLRALGVTIVQPPTDQPWGARSFVALDPNGVALYFSHPIPAALEFQACVR